MRTGSGMTISGFPDARLVRSFRPCIAFQIASRSLIGMAATSGFILEASDGRLQEENLIKPLPRLGYMVTTLDIFEVRELVELRRELEGYAGYLAAQRITAEQLEDLRTIIREAETETAETQDVCNITEYF